MTRLIHRRFDLARLPILFAAILLGVRPVAAVGTDPSLVLTSSEAVAASGGTVAVGVNGSFNFEDVVQFSFPCGLILYRGTSFVRYDFTGTVVEGASTIVNGGITAAEIPALLLEGAASSPPASLVRLGSDRIDVALPGTFGSGNATAIVYAILEGDPFVSNAIAVSIP